MDEDGKDAAAVVKDVERMQSVGEETETQWEDTMSLIGGVAKLLLLPPPDGDCDQRQILGGGYKGMGRNMAEEGIQHQHLSSKMAEVVQG